MSAAGAGEPSIRDALHALGLSDLGIGLVVGIGVTLVVLWVIAPAIAGRFVELPETQAEILGARVVAALLERDRGGDHA